MKPLILWARDNYPEPYTLRIANRTSDSVYGHVRIGEAWLPFHYDRKARIIRIQEVDHTREITINQWGWEQ